jgi:plastocyanin
MKGIGGAACAAAMLLAGAAGAEEIKIGMLGSKFSKQTINAKVGDTLIFENDDQVDHDVFVPTFGHGVNPGNIKPGQSVALPLGKAGSFDLECVYHVDMTAKVTVAK